MRLINTKTFEFKTFFDTSFPEYAILSHRWGSEEEEVSYKQFRKGSVPPDLPGLVKLQAFCRLADTRGFQWAWIDTCCIDKRSSAELSEAINSMFKWYRRSTECYVHMADVEFSDDELSLKRQSEETFWHAPDGWAGLRDRFGKSSWLERGWTLQELIAPDHIVFYDSHWNEIGPLKRLYKDVAKVTGIDEHYLAPRSRFRIWPSVATRMSWASRRHTSREEDIAYCLLGIFDVNMPLLYGEGAEKAFVRLQTEIMKDSDDESLFAWVSDQSHSSLFAGRPSYFANSGDIAVPPHRRGISRPPYSTTNRGLEIALPKKHLQLSQDEKFVRLFLRCGRRSDPSGLIIPHRSMRALYVELKFKSGLGVRTNCAALRETSTYQIHNLDKDLAQNERIYVSKPISHLKNFIDSTLTLNRDGTSSIPVIQSNSRECKNQECDQKWSSDTQRPSLLSQDNMSL